MVLPVLIVGNELFILGDVAVAMGRRFLARRHGQLKGLAALGMSTEDSGRTTD